MSAIALPLRRPVATAMFFGAVLLLGLVAWQRIPVELLPPVGSDRLFVAFSRPGSDPEVVEREILLPLEARAGELPGVDETWGEINGSAGSFRIRFEPGVDLRARELELRRLAAEIMREQPRGSFVEVSSQDIGAFSRFVMFIQVLGMDDRNALLDLVEERIVPRLAAIPGLANVVAGGGAAREMTVRIDPDRAAAMGVRPEEIGAALARSVQRLRYLGSVEGSEGRFAVVLDGRPRDAGELADLRIVPHLPTRLSDVADVAMGQGREETLFRVNGQPTVALAAFQDEGANLVQLGRELRARLELLREEFRPYGVDFIINFDAAELVEEQLSRLEHLALSGFLIALGVLFLYLRRWLAVAVVGVAVPSSLLAALALLYLGGHSLNLITLFGLAVGIGMLVDNSIVVYEAVQRRLERGFTAEGAAEQGVRRTVRAIMASTLCNAIVFLPITFVQFDDALIRAFLGIMATAIVLPLGASLLVAVGLVPMLAHRLAAPAALARLGEQRRRQEELGGLVQPDRTRELFSGLLSVTLRRPAGWLTAVAVAVAATVLIALPWVAATGPAPDPENVEALRFDVEVTSGASLERTRAVFEHLERAVQDLDGVKHVESLVREDGGGLTVHLLPRDERPQRLSTRKVRELLNEAAEDLDGVELSAQGAGGDGARGSEGGGLAALLGQGSASVVVSGPDARELDTLAREIEGQLESIPEIESARVETETGQDELRVTPDARALQSYGLTADEVLPALNVLRREGVVLRTGFTLRDGREVPLAVRREPGRGRAIDEIGRLRLFTTAGTLPLSALADVRRMPPPPAIQHHDGRREVGVSYDLAATAPTSGPARKALDKQIESEIQAINRPAGYIVEIPEKEKTVNWFKSILVPVLLLLYAVLAVTFESLTLPLLVLVSLPLTVLGATWALLLQGMPADLMALVGALALIGLTVNPAILLVDRMQQRVKRLSPGAAALAAVRERARPVLMTATTTVAGLWPLALATGQENEIWPPFATVVMGGLITSTLLTLLVVPVGFVFLTRLDRLFGRLGPWIVLGWGAAAAAVMTPLIQLGLITTLTWQLVTTTLVAGLLLGGTVLFFRRPVPPEPALENGTPAVEVRYLRKVYGRLGPIGRAFRLPERFARRVLERGGRAFDPRQSRERLPALLLLLAGAAYLATTLETVFWRIIFVFVGALLAARALRELRRARGKADLLGRVLPGGPENVAAALVPWVAYAGIALLFHVLPRLADEPARLRSWAVAVLGLGVAVVQLGRRTAVRLAEGTLPERAEDGRLRVPRSLWRRVSRRVFGLDLPREEVEALASVHFEARGGMIGILGPNGAGKTTLLRLLAGILDPSVGRITLGGVPLGLLRRSLARWVGYLPQDFGLPDDMTAREYLDYYALLYEIRPVAVRRERVQRLLEEVGLAERSDERIGGYSGGMRQRVAVARTLLRLPPVIIVDEPTVGLDPRERIRFRNLLGRLAEGRIVFFSTHVVEDAAVACERVIVLARGRVAFDGQPLALSEQARGKVWEVTLSPGEEKALPPGALVVDQVPDEAGHLRSRVLHDALPHGDARAIAPSLEDGYFWLVRAGVAR